MDEEKGLEKGLEEIEKVMKEIGEKVDGEDVG